MTTLTQRMIDGSTQEILCVLTHIFSSDGHFVRDEKPQGWHIQLGTYDSADNYTEVHNGEQHEVPESLPDIIVEPEEE